jgi:hypothetical protein
METLPPEVNIELDQPRETDLVYETLFGATGWWISKEFLPPHIQDQSANDSTRMGCSRYGLVHAINAQNLAVSKVDGMRFYEIVAKVSWDNYLKINPSARKDGATLQSALDQFLELGFITGYSRLFGIADMKHSIDNIRPIYTGSKKCNWKTVRDNHQYSLWEGYAHIFCIIGYNESSWIAINSYGPYNGVFYIDFKFTDSLFSCYSISDKRDDEVFANK